MEPLGSLLRLAAEMSNETQVRVDSGLTPQRFKVREMRPGDLPAVAAIHHENLPHGLFPQLGRGFLRRYLATFLDSPHAVGFVAVTHGPPVGFLVGTFEDRHHYRYVLRHHWGQLALRGADALAIRPRVACRFARTRVKRYARGAVRLTGRTATPVSDQVGDDSVLTHVAVKPDGRGRGAGSGLVNAFVQHAWSRQVPALRLVTTAGPDGAGDFYQRLGWQINGSYDDRDGVAWDRYRLERA